MNTVYKTRGKVFNVQRFSLHDGPGIRTTVFLKGCPLHCIWCHNPESWNAKPELMYRGASCIGCGECVRVCAENAHALQDGMHMFDRARCKGCLRCADVCPSATLSAVGEEKSVEEILAIVLRDQHFYADGGGMTVSGGEPFAQSAFLLALLQAAKEHGVHTAIETSGAAQPTDLLAVLPYADLFLYDCKMMPGDAHKRYVGCDGKALVENLHLLDAHAADIILRCPIIPGINDTSAHFSYLAELASKVKHICAIHIEPYHTAGVSKAKDLGREKVFVPSDFNSTLFKEKIIQELMPILTQSVSVPVEVV